MKVIVKPYNENWKRLFLLEKTALKEAIGRDDVLIEHIGSTSIEGLSAKPIIDVMVGVENQHCLDNITVSLLSRGYIYFKIYEENLSFRRFFVKTQSFSPVIPQVIDFKFEGDIIPLNERECHIHVVSIHHDFWKIHLKFRDILLNNPAIQKKYQDLKLRLSEIEWNSSRDYSDAKQSFIQETLNQF